MGAVLLQQKKAFFTGGFLTAIHARNLPEACAFLVVSFIVDASLAGVPAVLVLWSTARLRLTRPARLTLLTLGGLTPLAIWEFINYNLLTYLGDAFDLQLMFDLTGRSAREVLAVSWSHLLAPAALTILAVAAIAGVVRFVNMLGSAAREQATHLGSAVASAAALFVLGTLLFATTSATSDLFEDGLRRKASGQFYTNIAGALTDFDRDGFGIVGRLRDPAPFDAAIYPYAPDVPGNGIDEDAVGGDLPPGAPYTEPAVPTTPWRQRPDVVLVVLESFRADTLGRQVNGRPVTPVMDALAREGVSSALAFSHNGYTTQSRFHLLTGSLAGTSKGSLIDDFKAQGYETAYFSAQDESFGGPAFDVGFERADVRYDARQDRDRRYSTFTTAGSLAVSNTLLRERIATFLETRNPSRPLFLYVNFHDTHFPYHHRDIEPLVSDQRLSQGAIVPANAERLREMYANTAANVDRAVGATLDLVARSLGRQPAVIVTADHGESLFDEGFLGHGYALNDAQTRIPLIVRGLPMEIREPFGQVDLRPALVAALSRDTEETQPRLVSDPGKVVFQYLGTLNRPSQIAFTNGAGRLIYDFRNRRVLETAREEAADPGVAPNGRFMELVHLWERMVLARKGLDGVR
jgi:hypothetical protein